MDKARLEKLGQWAEQDAKEVIFPFWTSDFIVDLSLIHIFWFFHH